MWHQGHRLGSPAILYPSERIFRHIYVTVHKLKYQIKYYKLKYCSVPNAIRLWNLSRVIWLKCWESCLLGITRYIFCCSSLLQVGAGALAFAAVMTTLYLHTHTYTAVCLPAALMIDCELIIGFLCTMDTSYALSNEYRWQRPKISS